MRFIVIADSHIRSPDDDVATYPSNALMLGRSERVVELCNELHPEFVIHLGDIVHPLPGEDSHRPAVQLARDVYASLSFPIHFVAGNHDIGDKPDAMVAVPAVAEENYGVFEGAWGPAFRAFDRDEYHFVIVDTPVLNSGLAREAEQKSWLEADLATAAASDKRTFLFTHYPPFVRSADEDEHYDNLGEPARTWLLRLLEQYGVEAVFSGHVHNFLYNHYRGTELFVLPSTGFVRPDYSELAAVAPESEGGRDDPAKLGFFVVELAENGHTVRPVRTNGEVGSGRDLPDLAKAVLAPDWHSPVGVTLRHGLMGTVDFPTAGLDEFRRKTIRNDALLPGLWEARVQSLKIPIGDLAEPWRVDRLRHLQGRGMKFTVQSAGVPVQRALDRVQAAADVLDRWEIILWPYQYRDAVEALGDLRADVLIAVAPVVPIGEGAVHHFVTAGFEPSEPQALSMLTEADQHRRVDELVFRIAAGQSAAAILSKAEALTLAHGRGGVAVAELPRAGESSNFDDDEDLADWIETVAQAAAQSHVPVFLDGYVDHDRSYYPRIGLLDRHFNPRAALDRLIMVASQGGRSAVARR